MLYVNERSPRLPAGQDAAFLTPNYSVTAAIVLSLVFILSGCGGGSTGPYDTIKTQPATEQPPVETGMESTVYDAERFTIVVPEGWEVMDVDGGAWRGACCSA